MLNNFSDKGTYASNLDLNDSLKEFRKKFIFPSSDTIYLCGHSLGLQPQIAREYVKTELDSWARLGVKGHHSGENPWLDYHSYLNESMSKIVGSKKSETVVMNSLTSNLHFLMISFFRPTKEKYKILIDSPTFPSDKYAVQSHLKLHGLDPLNDLIEINTLNNNRCISNDEFQNKIQDNISNVAMILLSGVNYYTGQLFDINAISNIANQSECVIGLDLAHAAGNVNLDLHRWNIDFAAWCGYKYLNGGPGAPSGAFIHEKHHKNKDILRLEGWWGHNKDKRFDPPIIFDPIESAEAWQSSNPPILSMAALKSSLDLFDDAGISNLRYKSKMMTLYMEKLIKSVNSNNIKIITPSNPESRGSQLSIVIKCSEKIINNIFDSNNIVCDFRKPNVIRAAPCALYNTFLDIHKFVDALKKI